VRIERVISAPVSLTPASAPRFVSTASLLTSAASVPLFKAHCSYLL